MKMKKIAVLLSVILAVQGFIPDTALFASETASGNEAYATVIEDGGGAEAIGYEAPEVEEAETEEEDSISSDRLDDNTSVEWPTNATTVSAGSFDTIYEYHDGKGYGFAFWIDDGMEKSYADSDNWDCSDIRYRIDSGSVFVVKDTGSRYSSYVYYGSKVIFGAGFLSGNITEGRHTVEVAVKKNGNWLTGSIDALFKSNGDTEIIKWDDSSECRYISAKKNGAIIDDNIHVNPQNSTDSVKEVVLCKSGSDVTLADATITYQEIYSGDKHYADARYWYGNGYSNKLDYYLGENMPLATNVLGVSVTFALQDAVDEGWYDIIVTNNSGLKTRIKNAHFATNKPHIYSVFSYDYYYTGSVILPNTSSSYVAAYVYGINIPDDGSLIPTYYYNGNRISGEIKATERMGEGRGQVFILSKENSDRWRDTASELHLQLVVENNIQDYTVTNNVNVANGSVIDNIGHYLLLTDDWIKGSDEVGIIGYAGEKTVFSEVCEPVKYCDGGWYINVTKTHEDSAQYKDGYYTYKVYRKKNGITEYTDSYYIDFNENIPGIHDALPDEQSWKYSVAEKGWREYLPKVTFTVSPMDSAEIIASGEVISGKSIIGCISDSDERDAVSRLPFMRVSFYDSNGRVSYRDYFLGDGSEPEEDEFEEVIPVKGKIALKAPDFAVAKWKSSNKGIASVNKYGVVTGKSAGKVLITAIGKGTNPYNKNYTIYVEKPVLKNATLYNWDSFNINRKVSGVSRLKPVGYDSSDPSVLSIDDSGNVTVKKGGRSKLTIYYKYGSVSAAYTVKLPCFKKNEISMLESKTRKLSVVNKNSASSIVFTSSNEEVATVAYNGTITAISPGFTKISLLVNGEVYDVCKVTVLKPLIDQRSINLKPGKSMKLKLLNKSKNTVLVSSDNTVATVTQGGKVRGISRGTAVISTKIDGTVYDTCTVTVY